MMLLALDSSWMVTAADGVLDGWIQLPALEQCAANSKQAEIFYSRGDFRTALRFLTAVLDVSSEATELLVQRATCHSKLHDYHAVIADTRYCRRVL